MERPDAGFLHLALTHGGETSYNELLLTEPKRVALATAAVTTETKLTEGGFSVSLSTDAPAFHATMDAGGIAGEFSDNCITLLPGAPRTVRFVPREKVTADRFRRSLTVRHLRNTYR
jgi:beta-mannosidase